MVRHSDEELDVRMRPYLLEPVLSEAKIRTSHVNVMKRWSRGQLIKPVSRVRVPRGLLNPNPYPRLHIPVASTRTGFQTRDIPYQKHIKG